MRSPPARAASARLVSESVAGAGDEPVCRVRGLPDDGQAIGTREAAKSAVPQRFHRAIYAGEDLTVVPNQLQRLLAAGRGEPRKARQCAGLPERARLHRALGDPPQQPARGGAAEGAIAVEEKHVVPWRVRSHQIDLAMRLRGRRYHSHVSLRPETSSALARGRRLYNAGLFWEAHEAWEAAWLEEEGEVRQLLQGLIQVAAGYFKATVHRRPGGAVKLLSSGLSKLGPLPDAMGGLGLAAFREAAGRTLEEARRWERGEKDGLDPALIPRL